MNFFKNKWVYALAFLVLIVYAWIEAEGEGDFYIFMWAAGELSKGLNIYDHKFHNDYSYYYSVLFAMCLKPFFTVSFHWVKFCWLMLNIFLAVHLFMLLLRSRFYKDLDDKQKKIFLIGTFAFSFRFLHDNIHYAQITILMLWTCIYGVYSIYAGKTMRGSFILALGINIKLFPLVILPYLLYRKFYKAFFLVVLSYAIMMFLPSVLLGHNYNMQMLHSWWLLVNPSNSQHVLDVDERSFHGLSTLLATLLVKNVPDHYAMAIPRNIADLSYGNFALILLITRGIIVSLTLYFLGMPPFKKATNQNRILLEMAYILLVIPIIFPHQQHYAFLFTAPAFSFLWYDYVSHKHLWSTSKKRFTLALLIFIFVLCTIKLWLGEFNAYYEHFKILTYGALLMIPALMVSAQSLNKSEIKSAF